MSRLARWLPLRYALREMRGGLSGFYVFIACIALGAMSIAGVGSLAASLNDGLAREGRVILGGDLSFSLIQREAKPEELAFLKSHGAVSTTASLRAMSRVASGDATLVELKAVDKAYPLFGKVTLTPDMSLDEAMARRDGAYGAVADQTLLARLAIEPGARITVGNIDFIIRAALTSEPDKLSVGIGFGPRLMVNEEALRATGLLQPGSLVRWKYQVKLPGAGTETEVKTVTDDARAKQPNAGWEIRNRTNASPQLERNVNRFTQFLTIVGLTALLVGGVGVGNAVKSHLDRKRATIATLKALGASGRRVFAIYLTQVILLALIGGAIGAALGAALPFIVVGVFGSIIPLPIVPAIQAPELVLSLVYGLLTALAFAMWPLGRAHDVPVGALFRDVVAAQPSWPRRSYMALTALAIAALGTLAVLLAYDRRVALIYVGVAAAVFVLLQLVGMLVMAVARRAPRARSTSLRMAIANIHRPGALTPTIVLSLGLGIALLVTVIEIDGNLRSQFAKELPARAPAFYFLDIPSERAPDFDAFVAKQAPGADLDEVPMLRGRIVAAKGIDAQDLQPSEEAAWVLQSDRGITYSATVPNGSRLTDGQWWTADYRGEPLVSFEKKIADGLGLKVGDSVTVNVLGRNITAKIANLRTVDWQSLSINFVLVFSPHVFDGAPHTRLATLTYPNGGSTAEQENKIIRAVAQDFPMITTVRVKDALDAIGALIGNLVLAIRGASALTLLVAALVLGGALAAGHRHRVYDAVILKTLGATRLRLIGAYTIEYLLIAAATALFGVLSGTAASWLIVTELMRLPFSWQLGTALAATFAAVLVTVVLGLAGTFSALGQKPAPVLRNL
ncbi:ABC transporter permease [Undibacter mobilis]|uniref:ABC transporter permease n=1 Tax=Undibacter mobilis TaxID=2292256 RepID=A0A371B9H2_9BRAD|nr:FtsX-like permease family protein [Undibacter mobilis]RDV04236.1 ABC transporter permease [Undibacter mobilis]